MADALVFAALAEPMRVAIVEKLAQRPMAVGELAAGLPVSRPGVSQHLKVLKEAGLIRGEVDGPRVCYCIEPRALRRLKVLVVGM
jgi:ArsR family transcriptional regulator, arsenate/arsenite/antimonite-responsive transcriptional repressor